MTTNIDHKTLHFARLWIVTVLVFALILGVAKTTFAYPASVPLNFWEPPASIPIVFTISNPVDLSVPHLTVENASVLSTLNDSLFRLGTDGSILPLAASDYAVSLDGLVYTVTLRAGALWSDSQPVTAQHYVDGILRVLDPNVGSDWGYVLYPIKNAKPFNEGTITDPSQVGIVALNDQTLEFTLEGQTSHFPNLLTTPATQPARQDVIDLYGDTWTSPEHFVSNGLYTLTEYDDAHVVVDKSLTYNGPIQATFSQMAFTVINNPDDQIAAYKNGSVDVLLTTPVNMITGDPDLKKDMVVIPGPSLAYIGFTTQVSPTNNPLVRKALASAVDRQVLIDNILMTPWRVKATGVIPPELAGYQGSEVGYSYNPAQAQSFLAQAGYPGGSGFPELNMLAITGSSQSTILEEVAAQWESVLGITVNVHYFSGNERIAILAACRDDPSSCAYNGYIWGWFVDYLDAYNILNDLFHPDSPYNYTQWDNSSYRSLVNLAASELLQTQRINYLQQAEKILVEDDAAVMPLYHVDGALVVRPGIYPYYSLTYYSYLAYWSNADPPGDGAATEVINASGGTVTAEDGSASIDIPPNALSTDVSISVTDLGGNYQITTSQEEQEVLSSFSVQPHGLQFSTPVTLTFSWNDANDDGIVDDTNRHEAKISLIKDGIAITPACEFYAGCNMTANTISVEVSSLSHFELVTPLASFSDVPTTYWAWQYVESIYLAGITGGCGGGNYCPSNSVTRAQMAVFLLKAEHGSAYLPPTAIGVFNDVSTSYWAADWIEQLATEGITGGCGGGNYCPANAVTRAQMAVFLLKAKYGNTYVPPTATGVFNDVPTNYWAADWVEQLATEGITGGCGGGNYCPNNSVNRAQMAVFLQKTFSLPMP